MLSSSQTLNTLFEKKSLTVASPIFSPDISDISGYLTVDTKMEKEIRRIYENRKFSF